VELYENGTENRKSTPVASGELATKLTTTLAGGAPDLLWLPAVIG
jgi:hypothetical protein